MTVGFAEEPGTKKEKLTLFTVNQKPLINQVENYSDH